MLDGASNVGESSLHPNYHKNVLNDGRVLEGSTATAWGHAVSSDVNHSQDQRCAEEVLFVPTMDADGLS